MARENSFRKAWVGIVLDVALDLYRTFCTLRLSHHSDRA